LAWQDYPAMPPTRRSSPSLRPNGWTLAARVAKFTSNEFVANIENANPKANPCARSKEESCKAANAMSLFDQHNKATFNIKGSKKVCAEAIFGKDERVGVNLQQALLRRERSRP
jgi:CRISPR/Cas system CMR-associated protein Cmr3 (group 5 of RAMP superfamily)